MKPKQIRNKFFTLLLYEIATIVLAAGIYSYKFDRIGGISVEWIIGFQPLIFYLSIFPRSAPENKYRVGRKTGWSVPIAKEHEGMSQDEAWSASNKAMIRLIISLFLFFVAWVWAVYIAPIIFT